MRSASLKYIKISVVILLSTLLCFLCLEGEQADSFHDDEKAEPKVVINEVCSLNNHTFSPDLGMFYGWIELYNKTDSTVSLTGYSLTDDAECKKFTFEEDVEIKPYSYRIVYMSDAAKANHKWYADFSIHTTGDMVYLFDEQMNMTDSVKVPGLAEGVSYARIEDGMAEWQIQRGTPNESNNGQEMVALENIAFPPPVFSRKSGFYEEEFDLSVYAQRGLEIYYTTDGSVPDEDSMRYQGTVHISDVSDNPNIYSAYQNVSSAVAYAPEWSVPPKSSVDKCTIIRAKAFGDNGYVSQTATAVYFVGYEEKTAYENMNVISLVTDPDHLFDYDQGIYVLGRDYDESELNHSSDAWWKGQGAWWWEEANYRRTGRQAERPVHITYFNEERELVLDQEAGIRIKGGGSRGFAQKSFNLYARKDYASRSCFDSPIFENGLYPKSFSLFSGGDDKAGKLKDYLAMQLAEDLAFETMSFLPAVVFLDGEYRGLYYLTEKYSDNFLHQYYGVEEEDIVIIKNGQINAGKAEDLDAFNQDRDLIASDELSVEESWMLFCEKFDVESYIDYYAFQTWIGRNNDWPGSNYAVWKVSAHPQYGKWRWMLFDVNSGGMRDYEFDSFSYLTEKDKMFAKLIRYPEFRKRYLDRVNELGNVTFAPDRVIPLIEEIAEKNRPQMRLFYDRFYVGIYTEENYEAEIAGLKEFFPRRYSYLAELERKWFPGDVK